MYLKKSAASGWEVGKNDTGKSLGETYKDSSIQEQDSLSESACLCVLRGGGCGKHLRKKRWLITESVGFS